MKNIASQRGSLFLRAASAMAATCACIVAPTWCLAVEHFTVDRDGAQLQLSGKVVVEAQDGGVLLMDATGQLWTVQPDEIVKRSDDKLPFQGMNKKELSAHLLKQLPEGFEVHTTAHYLICYNTSKSYAYWCGALFERLYRAFTNFWTRRGLELHEPDMPLVAIVFSDKDSYKRYAASELGDAVNSIIGYYNLLTNRVVMFDLTGHQAMARPQSRSRNRSSAEINRMLSSPEAGSLVATVIHEATHQIAFNCGLQTRLADIPIWLSEEIAMYFETPDLQSSKGWRGLGSLNRNRLMQFRGYRRNRHDDSVQVLLADDKRIQGRSEEKTYQGREALLNAYAESWCLTYFLIKHKPKQFNAYLKMMAAKDPLIEDGSEARLKQFEEHFGDLEKLDAEFLRQISRLR